jgi:hypothetical protein
MLSLRVVREGQQADFIWDITQQTLISLFPYANVEIFLALIWIKENLKVFNGDVL